MDSNTTLYNVSLLILREDYLSSTATSIVRNTTLASNAYEWRFILPPYFIIFLLSICGNCLVIATLASNRRMRTVTNVYLLNLAISDFLLGVFCLPFTLVGQIYRRFLFGAVLCKLIPFLQAVSVSVDVWTLVAISLERYFAICRPLKSRKWQTQCHAYKMIAIVWIFSVMLNSPILIVSTLQPMRGNAYKCREVWTNLEMERIFNLALDAALLLIPFFIMSFAYSLIVTKLWRGMRHEIQHNFNWQKHLNGETCTNSLVPSTPILQENPTECCCKNGCLSKKTTKDTEKTLEERKLHSCMHTDFEFRHVVRSTHIDKSIDAKRKVIRMLFVIILEFFVCWAPLHVINTLHAKWFLRNGPLISLGTFPFFIFIREYHYMFGIYYLRHLNDDVTVTAKAIPWRLTKAMRIYLFYPEELYQYIGSKGIVSLQLLAYCSSCCNPITYCFMNRKFRQAFIALFKNFKLLRCCFPENPDGGKQVTPQPSSQDATACVIRGSHTGRTVICLTSYLMPRVRHGSSSRVQTPNRFETSQNWMDWKVRIVFSSGSQGTALGSGVHRAPPAPVVSRPMNQVIETGEEGSQFLYRITWPRSGQLKSNVLSQPVYE